MEATSVTVGKPVTNLEISHRWDDRALDRAIGVEPARHIVEYAVAGLWAPLVESESSGNAWVLRDGVEDLDDERGCLASLGVGEGKIVTIPGDIAYFDFRDPDGNRLSIYHLLEPG